MTVRADGGCGAHRLGDPPSDANTSSLPRTRDQATRGRTQAPGGRPPERCRTHRTRDGGLALLRLTESWLYLCCRALAMSHERFSALSHQLPQHVRQDPAVAEGDKLLR